MTWALVAPAARRVGDLAFARCVSLLQHAPERFVSLRETGSSDAEEDHEAEDRFAREQAPDEG